VVYTYSIGNFPTLRCLEQIRNDVCANRLNVKIIAVGSGFPYGQLGMSHHATEDIAVLRALPEMTVFSPADPMEGAAIMRAAHAHDGPCYIRLAKGGEQNIHPEITDFDVYRAIELLPCGRVNILAVGAVSAEAKRAAGILAERGISAGMYIFPAVKPLDRETVQTLAASSKLLVTVEEHNVIGGFGGAVAEIMAGMSGERAALMRLGLQDIYTPGVGDAAWLRAQCGIDAESIAASVEQKLQELGI